MTHRRGLRHIRGVVRERRLLRRREACQISSSNGAMSSRGTGRSPAACVEPCQASKGKSRAMTSRGSGSLPAMCVTLCQMCDTITTTGTKRARRPYVESFRRTSAHGECAGCVSGCSHTGREYELLSPPAWTNFLLSTSIRLPCCRPCSGDGPDNGMTSGAGPVADLYKKPGPNRVPGVQVANKPPSAITELVRGSEGASM